MSTKQPKIQVTIHKVAVNCRGEAAEALLVGGLAPNTKPLLELNFNQFTQTEYRQACL